MLSEKNPYQKLKRKPMTDEAIGWIELRTKLQIQDPSGDKLTRDIIKVVNNIDVGEDKTILDVGCYGGWLYHFIGHKLDYHGIDNWPQAIQAAHLMFPPERFTLEKLQDSKRTADIVWATQLHPETDVASILDKLAAMANNRVFFTFDHAERDIPPNLFSKIEYKYGVFEGTK